MAIPVNVLACNPNVALTEELTMAIICFETVDPRTLMGNGKQHTVALSTSEAMKLLGLLQAMQRRHALEIESRTPYEIDVPPPDKKN